MTWNALRLFQIAKKLEALNKYNIKPYNSNKTLVEGVPGSGKTFDITYKANKDDLILTVARYRKDMTADRVAKLHKVTTVSFFKHIELLLLYISFIYTYCLKNF